MKLKKLFLLAAAMGLAALPCAVVAAETETLCSGESAEVTLDLATGTTRTPAATETLTYSTEWDGGDAVTLAANGETLASGLTDSGTYDWTPSGSGLFTLTHTTATSSGDVVLTALFNVPVLVAKNVDTGTKYETVQAAFDAAAAGQTIQLITDVVENVEIKSAKANTLDLAGHVLKGGAAGTAPVVLINSADAAITIRDTSTGHTGAITTGGTEYADDGAGINIAAGSLSLYDVTITNCVASGYGGAIYGETDTQILAKKCLISGNSSVSYGGGVFAFGALVLSDCVVRGNSAAAGGGLYVYETAAITNCIVANNNTTESAGGIYVANAGTITVKGGEISGNATTGDGGGVCVTSVSKDDAYAGCKATLIDVVLSGNSAANGGAVCQCDTSELLMRGCTVTNNTATVSGGGICKLGDDGTGTVAGKCVLIETVISGNTSGENGGGVYFRNATCLAAGTLVTMADGTTKAIEDVKEGDFVRTFDHEGGTNSTARVYLAYQGETKETPFTLWFDNGEEVRVKGEGEQRNDSTNYQLPTANYQLPIVGRHDLLLKDTRKYVTITESNVGQYLGAKFYGADGAWHTLTNVTMGTKAVEYHSIYTTPDRNVFANGLLTVADDADFLLNLYELDENLKADPDQLAADIAQYGLCTQEEAAERFLGESLASVSSEMRALYDVLNIKYFNVAVGKQLVSWTYLQQTFATVFSLTSSVSFPTSNVPRLTSLATANEDVGLKTSDVGGQGLTALPKLSLAAAPKLGVANAEPTLDDFDAGALTLGTGAVVTNNTANGAKSNIHLATAVSGADSLIKLDDSHDGVRAGVSCSWGAGQFTKTDNVSASDVALFTSDDPAYIVEYDGACLVLAVPEVTFVPSSVDHATAAVYVDDVLIEAVGNAYQISSNATATVVYMAESGYVFSDGETTATKIITTSVNPATAEAPAAPVKLIKYVAPTYVDNIASNGIAYWTTNSVYNYTIVTSAAERVTWGTAGATSWYVVTNGTYQIDGGVACTGNVHLVLCDGAKLTVTNVANSYAGIATDASGSFTIYETVPGDAAPSPRPVGILDVTGDGYAAGIGGNFKEDGSNITINGGIVTARSGEADEAGAGIGGGSFAGGSNITINGGVVVALAAQEGAGIGGGYDNDGLNITINGGTVTATGGVYSAGIGGGGEGGGGECITINGGKVTATGGEGAAGIGGGSQSGGSDIAIRGGVVTAIGGLMSTGIGGGSEGTVENVWIANAVVFVGTTDVTVDEGEGPRRYSADLIGGGALVGESSSGIVIDETAQVFFNLTGLWDYYNEEWLEEAVPMPETFAGFVIMTPATQTVDRVLVGGIANWTAKTTFTLRKPAQERTKAIAINGESVPFANAMLTLTNDVTASVLKLTAAELPDETTVTGQGGEEVKIAAEDDRLEELGIQKEDMVDTKNVQSNGLLTWQSYVLGLDPTNRLSGIYADAPQNTNENAVTIETVSIDTNNIAPGFGLGYTLTKVETGASEKNNTPSFEVDITESDPTGHYKLSVVITSNDVELAETAEAINVVGMVKQTQSTTNAVISVPWGKLAPGENQEIAVSNVVKTATLDVGDRLIVYRPGETNFESWVLNADKQWGKVITASAKGVSESGAPESTTIPRGSGIWLSRQHPQRPYYLYGQSNGEESEVTLEKGPNLVGATGLGDYDLNEHVTGAKDGDSIVVPGTNSVPKVLTFKDGKWGYWKTVPGKTIIVKGVEKTVPQSVWTTDESLVKPGTGFWLHNRSGWVEVK